MVLCGLPSTINDEYQLNLHKILQHAAKVHDEVEVISYRTLQNGSVHKLNYLQVYERVCAMANALESLGVKPGDIVAILGWNDHRYFESYFSVSGIGAVLLQLNIRLHLNELTYIVEHAGAKVLFVDETLVELAERIAEKHKFDFYVFMSDKHLGEIKTKLKPIYNYEELISKNEKRREWDEIDEKSSATACYTAGTVGNPKGVFYSHRALILQAITSAALFNITSLDTYLQIVPFYHVNGWTSHLACPMMGCRLILPGLYNPAHLVKIILNEKVTIAPGSPAILSPILEELRKMAMNTKLDWLRIVCGSTEPSQEMLKGYAEFGVRIIHAYGATETSPLAAVNLLKPQITFKGENEKWDHMRKQGLFVFGIEAKLVDPSTGKELPWNGKSVGELWLRGPWVIKEYYNDPRTRENVTEDGWWKSGDVGTIDELGYFHIVDRLKDIIKSGEEWIPSVDLEKNLMSHPFVYEAVVIGIPHPRWGERPLALVVLKNQYRNKPKQQIEMELREHMLRRFARWQLPDQILFVEEIPKTSTGKINKKILREKYKDVY
ncbi:MAG: long-chain-fatty-acid--CoA ligase, partial [Archaeoglobaceae archaeon]|nr:long-chain-fatty-acid--CoA ligase [Archaeoglobaceae archaeon]